MSIVLIPLNLEVNETKPSVFQAMTQMVESLFFKDVKGVVLPQGSILGPFEDQYASFEWFSEKQDKAIKDLQQTLCHKDQFIITATFKKDAGFMPIFITDNNVQWVDAGFIEYYSYCFIFNPFIKVESHLHKIGFILTPKPFMFSETFIVSHDKILKDVKAFYQIHKCPVFHLNYEGASDNLVWDKVSAFQLVGEDKAQIIKTSLLFIQYDNGWRILNETVKENIDYPIEEKLIELIKNGIRSYFYKGRFKKVVIGLSGGIDSALVAVLATLALGKDKVKAILLPGPYSSSHSIKDSQALSIKIGIDFEIFPISDIYEKNILSFKGTELEDHSFGLMHENIQARIRGNILMAYSNALGALILNTCNKSEDAVGYSTLYGDTVGGLAPIGDLYKTDVYRLSRFINSFYKDELIPYTIIDKAPSAELRPNQKDSDSLPEYDVLDKILKYYLDENISLQDISKILHIDKKIVLEVIDKIHFSEYKRRQSPPVLWLTEKEKGLNRLMSLTQNE